MAIQVSYTNEYGDVWPESYWVLTQQNLNRQHTTAILQFMGYKDLATYTSLIAGEIAFRPVLMEFMVSNNRVTYDEDNTPTTHADYTTYFDKNVINPEGVNNYKKGYEAALDLLPMFDGGVKV